MVWVIAFILAQVGSSAFACWRGGAPERCVAVMMVAAALATILLPRVPAGAYQSVFWGVLWVDLALFVALLIVALLADRFWPLWLTALQAITLAMHGVRGYDHHLLPYAYWLLVGKIAYPMMALLVVGTMRHHDRVLASRMEFAWTRQRLDYQAS